MNWQATLPSPVGVTFALVADPSRLGDWLPEVTGPAATAAEVGAVFSLTFGAGPGRQAADGEVIAFEPPWLVGYRLFIGSGITTLRVTCAACPAGSQVHLQQAGDLALAVDLGRLARVLGDGLGSLRAEPKADTAHRFHGVRKKEMRNQAGTNPGQGRTDSRRRSSRRTGTDGVRRRLCPHAAARLF
jgi:hypothetical protein